MPSKQAIHEFMMPLFELLTDLALSFIGYYGLVLAFYLAAGTIAWVFFQAGWTFPQMSILPDWREDIIRWTVFSLWAIRFVLRWRRHVACSWGCLASILRWLSPLSPKPFDACLGCRTAKHGEPVNEGHRRNDGLGCRTTKHGELVNERDQQKEDWETQPSIGIFLWFIKERKHCFSAFFEMGKDGKNKG